LVLLFWYSKGVTAQHYIFSRDLFIGIIFLDITVIPLGSISKHLSFIHNQMEFRHISLYINRLLLSLFYTFLFFQYFPVRITVVSPLFLLILGSQLHLWISLVIIQGFRYIRGTTILFFLFFIQIIVLSIIRNYIHSVSGLILLFGLIIYLVNLLATRRHESSIKDRDIAEKINGLKTKLLKYERTRQLEAMTASFIHEVNNPLTPMEGNVFFIREQQEILASLVDSEESMDSDTREVIKDVSDELLSICNQYEVGFTRIQKLINRIKHVYLVTKNENPQYIDAVSVLNDAIMLTVPMHLFRCILGVFLILKHLKNLTFISRR